MAGVSGGRVWLEVPFAQKEAAKAAGARWDPRARRWYAPGPLFGGLEEWLPRPAAPALLPGEDRGFGSGLFVDLVPSSCWFTNVRSCVDVRDWDRLRVMVYARADHVCEACGAGRDPGAGVMLEAHERWAYDPVERVQVLRRLVCLCSRCHGATHFGWAALNGRDEAARTQLATVNGWDAVQVAVHVDAAFALWHERSRVNWTLDLRMLTEAGIRVGPVPSADRRRELGEVQVPGAPPLTDLAGGL